MKKCIFISRHEPNDTQIKMCAEKGYDLFWVGDCDAFNSTLALSKMEGAPAVAVVHPALAILAIQSGKDVLVFQNGGRDEGFVCKNVHIYKPS